MRHDGAKATRTPSRLNLAVEQAVVAYQRALVACGQAEVAYRQPHATAVHVDKARQTLSVAKRKVNEAREGLDALLLEEG